MKRKFLSLTLAILTVLLSLSLAGCGKKKTSQVYFLNFKPESASVYEEIAKKLVLVFLLLLMKISGITI